MRSLATRRAASGDLRGAEGRHRALQGSRASTWSSSRPPASASRTPRSSIWCDLSLYVMTSEYGAASQLEKIDMLDFADIIVLNKSEKRGAADALRDVRKQWRRNHPRARAAARRRACPCFRRSPAASTIRASIACSPRCARRSTAKQVGAALVAAWRMRALPSSASREPLDSRLAHALSGGDRAGRPRGARAHRGAGRRPRAARYGLYESLKTLHDAALPGPLERYPTARC